MKVIKVVKTLFRQDYFFSVFSKMVGVVIAIVYSAFYNRYLGTVLKGDAAIISNYISLISSFAALGMYQAYPFYRKKGKDIFYSFVNNTTTLYCLLTLSCLIFVLVLPIKINLKIAIALVPIQAYIRQINYVVMVENPRRRNVSSIVISVLDLLVVLSFFFLSKATYGFLICILITQNLINLMISYCNLKVDIKRLRFDLSQIIQYIKFGILPMFTLILMTLNYRIDIFMLSDVFNIQNSEIGIYSVGVSLAEKIWLVPDAIKDILMSKLSNGSGASEVAKVTRTSIAVSFFMLVLMVVFGKPVVLLLYGAEFEKAYEILIVMLVGVIGMVFYKMVYAFNVVQGRRIINLVYLGGAAVVNAIGNYFLIPIGGILAAAWASVISYLVCGGAFLIYFHRTASVKYSEMLILKKSDVAFLGDIFRRSKK